jgi:hypothetical protein
MPSYLEIESSGLLCLRNILASRNLEQSYVYRVRTWPYHPQIMFIP